MQIVEPEVLARCLFNESNDAFFIFDPSDSRLLEINPTAQRLTGLRRKELLRMRVADLLEGTERLLTEQFEDACRTTQFFHARDGYRLKRAAGIYLDVNISISRLHAEHAVLGLVVVRDVSERKRSEDLRVAYQLVLEKLATGSSLEKVLATLTQIAERLSPGMQCSVLLMDKDRRHLRHGTAPSLPEEYNRAVDGMAIGPEQGSRWSQPIFSSSGQVLGTFAMDYTETRRPNSSEIRLIETAAHIAGIAIERRNIEAELLRQQAQLGHVSRLTTVGELAAGIAHEVTQPASAIANFAAACATILERNSSDETVEVKSYLHEIRGAAHRIGEIVDRLRAFVKGTTPSRSTCELRSLIQDVLILLAAELHRHNVTVLLDPDDRDCPLFADRVQLQQVFVNLIMNACDAIEETGRHRGTIWIASRLADGLVHVTVEDTGVGLPPEQSEQVFEPFFTTKKHGIGIGLSICRTIVEAHGGQIQIMTPTRGGSAFHVTLPIVHADGT